MHTRILVQTDDFDAGCEYQALRERAGGNLGAVVNFIGLVRDRHQQEAVSTLHLEHYPGMTERSMARIVSQAGERWPLDDVVVIHRVGSLAASEQIVFVQVGSRHRDAAFAGAEYIMDYLKTEAVFRKREDKTTGSRWVESTSADRERRGDWEKKRGDWENNRGVSDKHGKGAE